MIVILRIKWQDIALSKQLQNNHIHIITIHNLLQNTLLQRIYAFIQQQSYYFNNYSESDVRQERLVLSQDKALFDGYFRNVCFLNSWMETFPATR